MDQPPSLSPDQRTLLLAIARRAIGERVRGKPLSTVAAADSLLSAPGAAFVTLMQGDALRGCIGYVHAITPLGETVARCAASAASEDPRFPPVTEAELPHLRLEISVLSPLSLLSDPAQLQVGLHGLCVSHKGRRGLLLPQVASERRWDAETFLRQTCLKAGLPPNQWRHDAEVQVFTVDHFTDALPVEPEAAP
jgi:AmmeMemoRadiSam system protein A